MLTSRAPGEERSGAGESRRRAAGFAAGLLLAVLGGCSSSTPDAPQLYRTVEPDCRAPRPFTPADDVSLRRLADPDLRLAAYLPARFKVSPDGRHVLLVDQRASPLTGEITSRLLVHDMAAIAAFARGERSRPAARILAEHVHGDSEAGAQFEADVWRRIRTSAILQARWLDDDTITYLGDRPGQPRQLFEADIETGQVRQITHHARSLHDYALADGAERFVFAASVPARQPEYGRRHAVVDARRLIYFRDYVTGEDPMPWLQLFVANRAGSGPARPVGEPFASPVAVSVSPSGDTAVVVNRPFAEGSPDLEAVMASYPQLLEDAPYLTWANDRFDPYLMHPIPAQIQQYQRIDLVEGRMEPLLNAPKRMAADVPIERELVWSPSGRAAVYANAYLPAGIHGESGGPVILVEDFEAGTLHRLITHARIDALADDAVPVPDLAWRDETHIEIGLPGHVLVFERMASGRWERQPDLERATAEANDDPDAVQLSIRQAVDQPPAIMARAGATGDPVVLDPIAPELACYTLGEIAEISWTGRDGQAWTGGLVYPVDYDPERTYGLVIQTHGYIRGQFLLSGLQGAAAMTPPYAAQALANRGLFVLVLPGLASGGHAEIERVRAGVEGAVDHLVAENRVDPARVGVSGFSRTGLYVSDLIAFSDIPFAAAIASDSTALSIDSLRAGFGSSFITEIRALFGADPWGESLPQFVARAPHLHTDAIDTPLRIEEYNPFGSTWATIYTLLRLQHRPVEMEIFPYGAHPLTNPRDQYVASQTSVDWFAYWLNGEERQVTQPGTDETVETLNRQYRRWDALRALSEPQPD